MARCWPLSHRRFVPGGTAQMASTLNPLRFLDGCESPSPRSEEHTSELQSRLHLVCRLLLEKKKRQRTHELLIKILPACSMRAPAYSDRRKPVIGRLPVTVTLLRRSTSTTCTITRPTLFDR